MPDAEIKPVQLSRVWWPDSAAGHFLRSQGPLILGEPITTRCGLTFEGAYTLWLTGTPPRPDCGNCTKRAPA